MYTTFFFPVLVGICIIFSNVNANNQVNPLIKFFDEIMNQSNWEVEKIEICKTLIFVLEGNHWNPENYENQVVPVLLSQPKKLFSQSELTNHEYSCNDPTNLVEPLRWISKLSRSCSVVVVQSFVQSIAHKLKELIHLRLIRLHIDYFVLFSMNSTQLSVRTILSPLLNDIRYVYHFNSEAIINYDSCSSKILAKTSPKKSSIFKVHCNPVLNGKKLKVTTVGGTPWIRFSGISEHGQPVDGNGIYYRLLEDAKTIFNFTYTLRISSNGGSSGFKRGKKWFGNIGDLQNRDSDIAIGSAITAHRYFAVESGIPFDVIARVFFVKNGVSPFNWQAILSPFKLELWLYVLGSILIVLVFLMSFQLIIFSRTNIRLNIGKVIETIRIMDLISILLDQGIGGGINVHEIMYLWLFVSLILGATYRSKLIFFLTFKSPIELPKSHSELVNQNYKLHFRYYGGVAYKNAMDSKDPLQHEIVRRSTLINSSQECIVETILSEEKAVCLDWDEHGIYASFQNSTVNVREVKDLFVKVNDPVMDGVWCPWMYRRMSPLSQTFNTYLLSRVSSGLFGKWAVEAYEDTKIAGSIWLHQLPDENELKTKILNEYFLLTNAGIQPLQVKNLTGVFGILILAFVLGSVAIILETVIFIKNHY